MIEQTTNRKSILRLINIATAYRMESLVKMRVNDSGYYIGSGSVQHRGEWVSIAVCFFYQKGTFAAVYGLGSDPMEYANKAHEMTGAPKHKLFTAMTGGDTLPQWVRDAIREDKEERIQRITDYDFENAISVPNYALASVEAFKEYYRKNIYK